MGMGDFFNKGVPILLMYVAAYGIWKRHRTRKGINSSKVDDTFEEQSSTSIIDRSFSSTVKDRLSELPDDVFLYILSLLSLRNVAKLSTLSTNLRNICSFLPCLDLEWYEISGMPKHLRHSKECKLYKAAFVKNVDQVFRNYIHQNFLSLRLTCCLDNNHDVAVDRWIRVAAANKHLRCLFLQFSCDHYILWCFKSRCKELKSISCSLLSQLFSLRELHLHCCIVKADNNLKLSNLTTLDLNEVILEGATWQGFLAGFSAIKCLYVTMCNLPRKLCIGENFYRLSFLNLFDCYDLRELDLGAKKLTTFEFQSWYDANCSFINVPGLEHVGFHVHNLACRNVFLNLAANATSLRHVFVQQADYLIDKLPSPRGCFFKSVLSLHMNITGGMIVKTLPRILNFFPLLRRLELKLPRKCCGEEYELPYLHENLKEVRLLLFNVEWIPVAAFFLQSAVVLDRMVLTVRPKTAWGYESQCFSQELLERPEGLPFHFRISEKECSYIHNALMEKAISSTVEVNIEN